MTARINQFDHNVTVSHIGGLFKGSRSQIWSINLQCSPKQEKKFTNFSNAAMLIRGKKLNCSERQLSQPNLVITLSNENTLTYSKVNKTHSLNVLGGRSEILFSLS